jgi:hypothetical protein
MIVFQSSCINACVLDCGSPLPLSHRLPRPLPSRLLLMFCVRYVFKTPILRNEPNFRCKLLSIKKKRRKHHNRSDAPQRFPFKVPQGQSRLFKAIQTYSRVLGKKDCLFLSTPAFCSSTVHFPRPMTSNQTNPNRKSTVRSTKSTVDLGFELLIWGKNGLQTPASLACRHPFRPITARKRNRANQKQTNQTKK